MARRRTITVLLCYLTVIFFFLAFVHALALSPSSPSEHDVHLFAAEYNFQRWLRRVRRSTSPVARECHNLGYNVNDHTSLLQEDGPVGSTMVGSSQRVLTLPTKKKHVICKKNVIYVEKDGTGNFTSIQDAINSVPRRNKCRVDIKIGAGVFREKLQILKDKPHITLKGKSPKSTIIVNNASAAQRDRHGSRLGTMHSATVAIESNYFIAKRITFKNSAPGQKPGMAGHQAVALRISGDKAAFFNCHFYGHQDTLYDHRGRHYFKDCHISGSVDFIFGNGRSLYEGAELYASANYGIPGVITAQRRRNHAQNTGFSFVRSRITGAGTVYLGRAWGADSRVVFVNTYMDKIVIPDGWGDWGIPARDKTVYYGQFNCSGPGADTSHRVRWARNLTADEAAPFLTPHFINGENWLEGYKRMNWHT